MPLRSKIVPALLRVASVFGIGYLVLLGIIYFRQRSMLFFPTHEEAPFKQVDTMAFQWPNDRLLP